MEEHKEHILDDDEHDSKLKKIIVVISGLFLVVLIISYIFVGFPLSGILRGQIESTPLVDRILGLDDMTILFENGTKNKLQEIYFDEQKVEFSVCLNGEKIGNEYYITSLYQPVMYDQRFNHVRFEPCSEETLIILHTHPYKSCLASKTDLETLKKTQERNANVLMVVMCEPDRFSVYS